MIGQKPSSPILTSRSGRRYLPPYKRLLVGAIAAILSLGFLAAALTLYTPFLHRLADDWTGQHPKEFGRNIKKVLRDNYAAARNVIQSQEPRLDSPLPDVHLILDRGDLDSLNEEIIPYGFGAFETKPRVRGSSRTPDGKLHLVQVSYRGTNTWHHQAWKPSLRIRYQKSDIVNGFRNHVLIAPESPTAMRNWLSVEFSRHWGMLSNDEHFVRLFLNGHYKGLYTRNWRFDESILIDQRRLPGAFFRLEGGTGSVFQRSEGDFWKPETWELKGAEPQDGIRILNTLYDALKQKPGAEQSERVNDLLDREAYAMWLAIRSHAGETHIHDHNLAFWQDTTSGKLVPLIIDANGYDWAHPGTNLRRPIIDIRVPVTQVWFRDPRNLALFVNRLHEMLTTFGSVEATESLLRETWDRIRPDALSDLYTSEMGTVDRSYTRTVFPIDALDDDVDAICEFVQSRNLWMLNQLEGGRISIVEQEPDAFSLLIDGLAGIQVQRNDGQPFALPGCSIEPQKNHTLYPTVSRLDIRNPSIYAFYQLEGAPEDYQFAHRLTGEAMTPQSAGQDIAQWRTEEGIHFESLQRESPPVTIGPGRVVVDATTEYGVGQPVTIMAGTEILLSPETSLYVRGPLRVEGTAEQPVTIRPLNLGKPFGVIGIFGPETAGTVIRHLDCEGGGTAYRENLFFTGMFSIHDCANVTIEDSRFARNASGDDTIHLARCRAVMRRCKLEDALSDALDWDKVDGRIESCQVDRSINDGFDLSMGNVQIVDCQIHACGDKGISVGEGTIADISRSVIEGCVIGVAAKDSSRVSITDCRLRKCETGWSGYCKKWRWGQGGTALLTRVSFEESQKADLSGDKLSRAILLDGMDPSQLNIKGKLQIGEPEPESAARIASH